MIIYYDLSLMLGGIIALIFGVVVFLNNTKKLENILWFLLNISVAVWSFGYLAMISSDTKEFAMFNNKILHGAAIFIPFFYLSFILALTKKITKYKIILYFFLSLSLFFLSSVFTKFYIKDVTQKYIFNYAPEPGFLYIYFTAYFFALIFFSLIILYLSSILLFLALLVVEVFFFLHLTYQSHLTRYLFFPSIQ